MNMDLPWLVFLAVAVMFFAIFETRAIWEPDRQDTLSHFVYKVVHDRPVTIYLIGMFTGVLVVHLFAHFCPA
jgi:hypothetical protein